MPITLQIALTLLVFALTLALILIRPRGLNEAWAAIIGGGLLLGLRLETPAQAWHTVALGADVLLFLLGLLILSDLLKASGFFEWAAILAARAGQRRRQDALPQRVRAGCAHDDVFVARYNGCDFDADRAVVCRASEAFFAPVSAGLRVCRQHRLAAAAGQQSHQSAV